MVYGDNNQKRIYDYYSRAKIKDADNESNGLELTFNFKNGMLVPVIQRMKGNDTIEYETLAEINITQTKALVLQNSMAYVEDQYHHWKDGGSKGSFQCEGAGITAGMKEVVSFLALPFDAAEGHFTGVTIGKVDGSGNYLETYEIKFRKDYHYGIIWTDMASNAFEKNYTNDVDENTFRRVISDFAHYMNGVAGYATLDLGRYDKKRILGKMDPIYDKLGIERLNNNGSGRGSYNGNNYYNSGSTGTSTPRSFDDYMNAADDDELPFN